MTEHQFPPETMLRFVTCIRHHTRIFVYNYRTWKCGNCAWYPGELDGPPPLRCSNCGNSHYTDDPGQALAVIQLIRTNYGYTCEVVFQIDSSRQFAYDDCNSWQHKFRSMIGTERPELSLCVGESK